jgi:TolB protein
MKRIIISIVFFYTTFITCMSQTEQRNGLSVKADEPRKIIEKKDVEYAYPHWSKDGKQILYQCNESGKWQIYRMNENGGNRVQITFDPSNNSFIDWSPDNTKIVFVSDRTGNEEIFIMDSDGKNQKQLTHNKVRDIHPYFTPKGDLLFFNSLRDDTTAFDIYLMNIDGTNVKRITHTSDDETCVHMSPTGNKIVFLRNNSHGLDDVFFMDLDTHREENLTNTKTTDGWPSWLPDGTGIIFSAIEDSTYKLFIYNLTSKQIKMISNPVKPFYDARANVSPDGKKVVFNREVEGTKNTIGIYVIDLK